MRAIRGLMITAGMVLAAVAATHPTLGRHATAVAVSTTPLDAGAAALAPFVGTWRVHGAELVINPDGTGSERIQLGPCTDSAGPLLCAADAPLRLNVDGGAVSFTFTSFAYRDQNGRPVVPDSLTGFPAVGDGYRLRLHGPGVIALEPLTAHSGQILGSRYMCGAQAPADAHRRLCNA